MSSMARAVLIASIGVLVGATCALADEPPMLRHNPFARPPSAMTMPETTSGRPQDPTQAPVLLATMVAGRDRLANVDGSTLRVGDEIYGYRIVRILEDRAIFERQGVRTTVLVKPQLEQDKLDESDE